ncbi:RICIN domain-containing protein [Streptomyces sp. NBC_01264]|uniref:RICIN domain-containing protein n=1 Tax=Streptomyces sp. NBC_01264 TaxID=2903804 RepID=UPI00225434EA|nr:RICIN domain-containing protein [Streptomyces sp. NBC_01264]MCX4780366.1 RICIN domain-containing protein [Streptomyces sp. NBC_01264]
MQLRGLPGLVLGQRDRVHRFAAAGDRLCLTLRNGQPTMKACSAADQAALWAIDDTSTAGALIKNKVSHTCLARTANDRVNAATCTGGPSQRWDVINGL